jgi:hypothetical protein
MANDKWKMINGKLFGVWWGNKPGAVSVIPRFPNHYNLIHRDVATLSIIVAQMQHSHFHFEYFTAQARCATAVDINLPAYKSC